VAQEGQGRISLIAAIGAETRAIGKDNALLWRIPEDLKRFKRLTDGHPVVMGRKTWESLPEKFRPLPGRTNIVVTRQQDFRANGAIVAHSLGGAIAHALESSGPDEIFVIGGAELYAAALSQADRLYLTLVESDAEGDAFFPAFDDFKTALAEESGESSGLRYRWLVLARHNG
jgi:dihydrofolate reductase